MSAFERIVISFCWRRASSTALTALLLCTACGGGSNSSNSSNKPGLPETPPKPLTSHPICIVSTDCPANSYCDLGECTQACNTDTPCDASLACSQRARCVKTEAEDVDPTPTASFKGTVTATTTVNVLSETDTELPITLKTTSSDAVRYRIQLYGDHLSLTESRGSFKTSTDLKIHVDASKLAGTDIPGQVRIFSELGEASVAANLHAGISGFYRGALTYTNGPIRLGDARLRLALSDAASGILAKVDSNASLLFPEDLTTSLNAATGSGTISNNLLTLTISQLIPKAFGGDRNHLGRDIGRQLTFRLKPTAGGGWKGDFEEQITGLFVQPVVETGTAVFAYEGRQGFTPLQAGASFQAVTLANSDLTRTIPGWVAGDCVTTLQNSGACGTISWANATPAARASCLGSSLYTRQVLPLYNSISGTAPLAYATLATECAQGLTATTINDVQVTAGQDCGILPLIECGVQLAAQSDVTYGDIGTALNKLVDGAINPVLLVAQERMMAALDSSIAGSTTIGQERAAYDKAASALNRAVTWAYQPAVLEGLRQLSPDVAASTATAAPPYTTYPAARAISKLLRTIRDLEAERTRLNAAEHLDTVVDRRNAAQASALSSFLEGSALNVLLSTWGNAPATVGADASGLLGPYDSAFGDAVEGAGVFGVPDSFVPFVFDPKEAAKGKNNFEQMLAIADAQTSLYGSLESAYRTASKAAKASDYELATQGLQLKTQYDDRISQICGTDFNIGNAVASGDVSSCGATSGQAATARTQVDSSTLNLQAALNQLQGMQDKIAIDMRVMKDHFSLHDENLKFLTSNGDQLDAIIWTEGLINAEQVAISTASQSNLANGFAPAALAIPMAMFELEKTTLNVARQDLQTAQQMHFEKQAQAAEQIDAQANIEKEIIDLAQYRVHIEQSMLDRTSARIGFANALAEAQILLAERAEAERVATLNPAQDPSYRMVRNDVAIKMLGARGRAQKYLFLAGRALEFELNQSVPDVMKAALVSRSSARMDILKSCLGTIPKALPATQSYTRLVSVRKLLGINGTRKDDCTGEELTEAQQFQRTLLEAGNVDKQRGVTLKFATDLMPGNGLWSTDVCSDRITNTRAQLVGDFLGDDEAQVNLSLTGAAIMRSCKDSNLVTWSLGGDTNDGFGVSVAVIQAGVNDFGKAAPNSSLYGQSVARAEWQLTLPGSDAAPTNSDVDLTKIEDIVLEITHEARPIGTTTSMGADLSCLQQVL